MTKLRSQIGGLVSLGWSSRTASKPNPARRGLLAGTTLLLVLSAGAPAYGTPIDYVFNFTTTEQGHLIPTGGFTYDSGTGLFSNFLVHLDGLTFDFTGEANRIGGGRRLPFELGSLAQNLIDGYGPLGPELSHWYAGPEGFYGFEWRTPAADFLYYDLTAGAPASPISDSPQVYAGTWSTTIDTGTPEVAEPGTLGLTALAMAAGVVARRRRQRSALAA